MYHLNVRMPFNEYVQLALSLFGLLLFFSSFKIII